MNGSIRGYIIAFSLLCSSYAVNAQVIVKDTDVSTREPKSVFKTVEQMPQFVGGEDAMFEFINSNLTYPKEALEGNIQGRTIVRFIVNELGKVVNAEIIRGLDPACDKEALRVVRMMPDWTPGKQNGQAVPVFYCLPLTFKQPSPQISVADIKGTSDEEAVDIRELSGHRIVIEEHNDDKPFMVVEQMPQFVGGEKAMFEFIMANLKYPKEAHEQEIQGRIVVRFVVNKLGKVVDAKIMRGLSPSCDKEALRVVRMMPDWTPGKQNGRNASCYFTLPIVFRLPVEEPETTKDNKEEKK